MKADQTLKQLLGKSKTEIKPYQILDEFLIETPDKDIVTRIESPQQPAKTFLEADPTLKQLLYENKINIKPYQAPNQLLIEILDKDIATIVGPRQYSVRTFSYSSPVRFIDSYGANSCLIVTMYDRERKKGLVAHLDIYIDIESSVQELLSHYAQSAAVYVGFYGGNTLPESKGLVSRTIDLLRETYNTRIVENVTNQTQSKPLPQSIILDLLTGKHYTGVGTRLKYQKNIDFIGKHGKIQQIY